MLGPMVEDCENQAFFPQRPGQFAEHIPFRSHFGSVPIQRAGRHLETIVMLGNRDDKAGAGFLKEIVPRGQWSKFSRP